MYIYSEEHYNFLKKIRKEKKLVSFFQILIVILILGLWEFLSRYSLINTFLFSSPSRIFVTIYNLLSTGDLFKHIGITLYEVLLSFSISSILGFIIAFLLWRFKLLFKIIEPYLTIFNSLPKVALGPLIIILVGASINSIIFMGLLISTFVTIINIYNHFNNTNNSYIVLLRSLGANKKQIFNKVILPSNYSNIINSLKINISMNLIGIIMGELLVSKSGLGYLIMYGSQVFNIDLVISSVFILGLISYVMFIVIEKIEILIKKRNIN